MDEEPEERVALAHAPSREEEARQVIAEVRRLRATAESKRLPVMFSPRACLDAAKLLQAGASVEQAMRWRVVRVVSAAEPLDVGRLMFVMAHPAMLRRLWLAVWDGAAEPVARRVHGENYGGAPYACFPEDLPDGITDPYVLPYLEPGDEQWRTADTALAWCMEVFTELGLLRPVG
ncbi:hypothetical protein [Actinomadura sp. WMMB 499]|uniref:DUF7192 family protein n=1 Tax=Actinomadura sp. WMMB 499 TaxID=1219491 RepID=UPI0020C7B2EE|nr:hypothetical protein [Actinomadura sp. WMMB 499]